MRNLIQRLLSLKPKPEIDDREDTELNETLSEIRKARRVRREFTLAMDDLSQGLKKSATHVRLKGTN